MEAVDLSIGGRFASKLGDRDSAIAYRVARLLRAGKLAEYAVHDALGAVYALQPRNRVAYFRTVLAGHVGHERLAALLGSVRVPVGIDAPIAPKPARRGEARTIGDILGGMLVFDRVVPTAPERPVSNSRQSVPSRPRATRERNSPQEPSMPPKRPTKQARREAINAFAPPLTEPTAPAWLDRLAELVDGSPRDSPIARTTPPTIAPAARSEPRNLMDADR